MLRKYYTGGGGGRFYHHTAPINMTYALHEALAIVLEEGLDNRIARHAQMHRRLRAGLEAMGLSYIPKHSLHTLNCINIPAGADDAAVRRRLLEEYGIEIGAGLGVMAGKAWRIGLMGHGATVRNVDLVLAALREILRFVVDRGKADKIFINTSGNRLAARGWQAFGLKHRSCRVQVLQRVLLFLRAVVIVACGCAGDDAI